MKTLQLPSVPVMNEMPKKNCICAIAVARCFTVVLTRGQSACNRSEGADPSVCQVNSFVLSVEENSVSADETWSGFSGKQKQHSRVSAVFVTSLLSEARSHSQQPRCALPPLPATCSPATRPTLLSIPPSLLSTSLPTTVATSIISLTRFVKVTSPLTTLWFAWQQTSFNCHALHLSERD